MSRHYKQSSIAPCSAEDQKLDAFELLQKNWDQRGSLPPTEVSLAVARGWLAPLREVTGLSAFAWRTPHMSVSEAGEVTFEWWCDERKVTLYFGEGTPEYLKVWGPRIFERMECGALTSSSSFQPLWLWLNAGWL